jgi:hypothetical protein
MSESTPKPQYMIAAHAGEPGSYLQFEIDETEFTRIREARDLILTVVLIDEKFGMVLENYLEFEQTLLDISLRYMVFADTEFRTIMGMVFQTSRRIQNLLSSAKLYVDQVRHDLSTLYGRDSAQFKGFEGATKKEYDARLGYRVMEALRNCMQHRSLPVGYVTVGWRRETIDDPAKHITNPELSLKNIRKHGGFKAQVLAELEAMSALPKLKTLVRDYVEGLAMVQADLRARLAADTERADRIRNEARDFFLSKADGKEPRSLHLVSRRGPTLRDDFYLGPEFMDHLKRLRWLYSGARHITQTIVSSEA